MLLEKIDSQVVAGQLEKEYMAREPELAKYLAIVRALELRFKGFTLQYILRAENTEADKLAKAATNNLPIPLSSVTVTSNADHSKGIQNNPSH